MARCIIISASPSQDPAFLRGLPREEGDYIICADGGIAHAAAAGIVPDLILGDFDSYQGQLPSHIPVIRYQAEKDQTDTYLAVEQGLKRGYRQFLLTGALGGRVDHTIANLGVLLYLKKRGADGLLADEKNEIYLMENERRILKRRIGFHFSLLPFGGESRDVSVSGAKYPLTHATLRADYPLGISNEFVSAQADIRVGEGPLLVILSRD